jgi:hypothetical protein
MGSELEAEVYLASESEVVLKYYGSVVILHKSNCWNGRTTACGHKVAYRRMNADITQS